MEGGKISDINDVEEKVKAWSKLTVKEHFDVIVYFLSSTNEDRHFAIRLLKRAGVDFKNLLENKTDNKKIPAFYDVYKSDPQLFDNWVRFGEEEDKLFAMWIKMYALGMTYEEIIKDSNRRDAWTPLEEKRKGKY